jgi:aminoglycoside phosphotransferase (APT) family kinase protein
MSEQSRPWQRADVAVTDDLVRRLLLEQAPGLGEVRYLHEGWDSRAFLVGETWIFRFPKHAASAARLRCEITLLPLLAQRLQSVAIPRFDHIGRPAAGYPFAFVGYRKLPGSPIFARPDGAPLATETIAGQVGRLCGVLHAFPPEAAAAAGVTSCAWYADLAALSAMAQERLRAVWGAVPAPERERLLAVLTDVPASYPGEPVLCHADLAPEHLLSDEAGGSLLGVIDFGDLLLGDPAIDLSGAYLLGGAGALAAALRAYPRAVDAGLHGRTRLFAASRIAEDLIYGIQDQRPLYVRAALRALQQL